MIFAVFASKRPDLLEPVLQQNYPGDASLKLNDGEWLVFDENITSSGVAEKLTIKGLNDAPVGSALVIGMSGYSGRQPSNVWEWIRAKLETN